MEVFRSAGLQREVEEDAAREFRQGGAIYRSAAVLADQAPERPLDDPHARTWTVGARVPHVPLSGGGSEISSLDAAGPGFAVLAGDGHDEWRRAAAEVSQSLGAEVAVWPAGSPSLPAQLDAAAGSGRPGTALVRPDGVPAWKPGLPAAEAAGRLASVMAGLLSRDDT